MKFLKINVKVLLILCLFSGILFLSTGCGDKDKTEDTKNNETKQVEDKKNNSGSSESNESNTKTDNNGSSTTDATKESSETKKNDTTDYSVWVANTTINTNKNQRSYKVIWGDTLWLISTAWEVPYQEIAAYNHIPNPDLIYVDQIIYNPLFK